MCSGWLPPQNVPVETRRGLSCMSSMVRAQTATCWPSRKRATMSAGATQAPVRRDRLFPRGVVVGLGRGAFLLGGNKNRAGGQKYRLFAVASLYATDIGQDWGRYSAWGVSTGGPSGSHGGDSQVGARVGRRTTQHRTGGSAPFTDSIAGRAARRAADPDPPRCLAPGSHDGITTLPDQRGGQPGIR